MEKKKNILMILSDQLSWKALSIYGNPYARTEHLDQIRGKGVCFDTCYTACPLCQPSRAALWTSRYPHELNVRSNGRRWPVDYVGQGIPTMGETFRRAGYRTVHFGKTHDAGTLRGFEVIRSDQDKTTQEQPGLPLNADSFLDCSTGKNVVDFLDGYREEKPFFVVADLINPHNICGWIGQYPGKTPNPWLNDNLPPLPENFDVGDMKSRPQAVQYICCSHNRQAQAAEWDEHKFRQYLYAYYYYIARMDQEVGRILEALERSGQAGDTLILFLSDHGESMAARKRVTKQVDFYEEVTRVPFVLAGPGISFREQRIPGLTTLLDVFPTLCGLTGVRPPDGLRGMDLSRAICGEWKEVPRDSVVSEWHTEWGYTVTPGRMLRTRQYKYMEYLEQGDAELYDLLADPMEKENLVHRKEYQTVVRTLQAQLNRHLEQTGDDFRSLSVVVPPGSRCHRPGYHNHRGPAAPNRAQQKNQSFYQEHFETLVCYSGKSDREEDNFRRAEILDLGGRDIEIGPGAVVQVFNSQKMGDHVKIGSNCVVSGHVELQDGVVLRPGCVLSSVQTIPWMDCSCMQGTQEKADWITVGAGSCLMAGVVVMPGVCLGRYNLVYPNAVVTESTPDYAVLSGNPASVIGRIDPRADKAALLWNMERKEK